MTDSSSHATERTERNSIGERLKRARGNASQGDYAKRFSVTTTTLGRYERGERTPDVDFISAICKETGVNPRWLILGEEPMYDAEASQERPRLKVKDLRNKSVDELPADLQRSVKKVMKGAQEWRQRWDELPDWAKDYIEELEEELDQAKAELLRAKDEAINAQNMALQTLSNRAGSIAADVVQAIQDSGFMYSPEELFEAMKSCSTPAELERLVKQGRKK